MQQLGTADFRPAFAAERIDGETWVIPLPLADAQPKYTLCYALADAHGDLHLIDTGVDTAENRVLLTEALNTAGGIERVASVALTHTHADHQGLAPWLSAASGASITLHHKEIRVASDPSRSRCAQQERNLWWGVPDDRQDELTDASVIAEAGPGTPTDARTVAEPAVLDIVGRTVAVIETPGHTSGHHGYVESYRRLVFTGDAVLPRINPGFGLGGENARSLRDLLESLLRLSHFDDHVVCPGHEYRFRGIRERAEEIARRHTSRNNLVRAVLDLQPEATVWDVAAALPWRSEISTMPGGYLRSALIQTSLHVEHIRSAPSSTRDRLRVGEDT